ncbi:hypothetical protein N7535_004872 [Penicillium sp. DV-2018c]|nr:hypothetical protein N7535_004872 [Penicillium sp. DV-2018c]
MASGGGPIPNHDSPAPGGPTTVLQSRPPGAGQFIAASRRPAPLKTEGLLWAGRRDACQLPGDQRRSTDPSPGSWYLLALPAPGGPTTVKRRSNDPSPGSWYHIALSAPGGPTTVKRRSNDPPPGSWYLLALPAPGGPSTVRRPRPPGAGSSCLASSRGTNDGQVIRPPGAGHLLMTSRRPNSKYPLCVADGSPSKDRLLEDLQTPPRPLKSDSDLRTRIYERCLHYEGTRHKHELPNMLLRSDRAVFAHGDIAPRNIMVDENGNSITGIIDWEYAGWLVSGLLGVCADYGACVLERLVDMDGADCIGKMGFKWYQCFSQSSVLGR